MKTIMKQDMARPCSAAMAGLYIMAGHAMKMAMDEVSGGRELQELAASTMRRINEIIEEHGK